MRRLVSSIMALIKASMYRLDARRRRDTILVLALLLSGCQGADLTPAPSVSVRNLGLAFTIPADVRRIAVFYPRSSNPDFLQAYVRLEGAAFQLKDKRSSLKIVDRFNLAPLLSEQRFQAAGAVTDDSAVRMGHMLGVDSVLLYSIEGATVPDRFFAPRLSQVRPIIVTTKIIRVESAEVVYHNVVTTQVDDGTWNWRLSDNTDYHYLSRAALERGISQTLMDLQRAFE